MHWTDDPILKGKSLRERFKWQYTCLVARGLPLPTPDEVADAMLEVTEPAQTHEKLVQEIAQRIAAKYDEAAVARREAEVDEILGKPARSETPGDEV